jgi:hypothetical protein
MGAHQTFTSKRFSGIFENNFLIINFFFLSQPKLLFMSKNVKTFRFDVLNVNGTKIAFLILNRPR